MFGRFIGSVLAYVTLSVIRAITDVGRDCGNPSYPRGAGYYGPAAWDSCGVCGMRIPTGAQVCPYCREQPNCRLFKYGE